MAQTEKKSRPLACVPVRSLLLASPARIAITGGTSWLGRASLELLEDVFQDALAERVSIFGSRRGPIQLNSGRVVEQQELRRIRDISSGEYVILHYAFLTKGHILACGLEDYERINDEIAGTVATAARQINLKGLFLPSSGAAYGPDRALHKTFIDNPYGYLKLRDEARFSALAQEKRARASIMRVFNLSGPCMNNLEGYALSSIIRDVALGGPIRIRADKQVFRSYVHVIDVLNVALADLLGDMPAADAPYDAAGEKAVELADLALATAKVMGRLDCAIERPAMRGPPDRYLGDPAQFRQRASAHGIELRPLEIQIADTFRDLSKRLNERG